MMAIINLLKKIYKTSFRLKAYTLIEVVITMAIVSLSILGYLNVTHIMQKIQNTNKQSIVATNLISDEFEKIVAKRNNNELKNADSLKEYIEKIQKYDKNGQDYSKNITVDNIKYRLNISINEINTGFVQIDLKVKPQDSKEINNAIRLYLR